jgi:hypothetical protein
MFIAFPYLSFNLSALANSMRKLIAVHERTLTIAATLLRNNMA